MRRRAQGLSGVEAPPVRQWNQCVKCGFLFPAGELHACRPKVKCARCGFEHRPGANCDEVLRERGVLA